MAGTKKNRGNQHEKQQKLLHLQNYKLKKAGAGYEATALKKIS